LDQSIPIRLCRMGMGIHLLLLGAHRVSPWCGLTPYRASAPTRAARRQGGHRDARYRPDFMLDQISINESAMLSQRPRTTDGAVWHWGARARRSATFATAPR
jgi:hypothetical protein